MKIIASLILLFFILKGCTQKEVALRDQTKGPELHLASDTVRMRERDYLNLNNQGIIWLQTLPASKQLHIELHDTSGRVQFYYRGQRLFAQQPFLVAGEWNTLFCSVDSPGIYAVDVDLIDQLGRTVSRQQILQVDHAVRPSAHLSWKRDLRDTTRSRYYFDASSSTQPYGKLVSYHYRINQQDIVSSTDRLLYIFHQAGQHPISFYVVDDLGQHSDTLHYSIQVP